MGSPPPRVRTAKWSINPPPPLTKKVINPQEGRTPLGAPRRAPSPRGKPYWRVWGEKEYPGAFLTPRGLSLENTPFPGGPFTRRIKKRGAQKKEIWGGEPQTKEGYHQRLGVGPLIEEPQEVRVYTKGNTTQLNTKPQED